MIRLTRSVFYGICISFLFSFQAYGGTKSYAEVKPRVVMLKQIDRKSQAKKSSDYRTSMWTYYIETTHPDKSPSALFGEAYDALWRPILELQGEGWEAYMALWGSWLTGDEKLKPGHLATIQVTFSADSLEGEAIVLDFIEKYSKTQLFNRPVSFRKVLALAADTNLEFWPGNDDYEDPNIDEYEWLFFKDYDEIVDWLRKLARTSKTDDKESFLSVLGQRMSGELVGLAAQYWEQSKERSVSASLVAFTDRGRVYGHVPIVYGPSTYDFEDEVK